MIKRFENFNQKLDYEELVNIISSDFENASFINMVAFGTSKPVWVKLPIEESFKTDTHVFLIIYLEGTTEVSDIDNLNDRLSDYGWVVNQYRYEYGPDHNDWTGIIINKIDDMVSCRSLAGTLNDYVKYTK